MNEEQQQNTPEVQDRSVKIPLSRAIGALLIARNSEIAHDNDLLQSAIRDYQRMVNAVIADADHNRADFEGISYRTEKDGAIFLLLQPKPLPMPVPQRPEPNNKAS